MIFLFFFKWAAPEKEMKAALIIVANVDVAAVVLFLRGPKIGLSIN